MASYGNTADPNYDPVVPDGSGIVVGLDPTVTDPANPGEDEPVVIESAKLDTYGSLLDTGNPSRSREERPCLTFPIRATRNMSLGTLSRRSAPNTQGSAGEQAPGEEEPGANADDDLFP